MQRRKTLSPLFGILVGALTGSAQPAQAHGPIPNMDEDSAMAAADFRLYCADCHGEDGRGQGPKAYGLGRPLPDLAAVTTRYNGTFPRERLIRIIDGREYVEAHGTREMPAWGLWLKLEAAEGLGGIEGDERIVQRRIRGLVDLLERWQR